MLNLSLTVRIHVTYGKRNSFFVNFKLTINAIGRRSLPITSTSLILNELCSIAIPYYNFNLVIKTLICYI